MSAEKRNRPLMEVIGEYAATLRACERAKAALTAAESQLSEANQRKRNAEYLIELAIAHEVKKINNPKDPHV